MWKYEEEELDIRDEGWKICIWFYVLGIGWYDVCCEVMMVKS